MPPITLLLLVCLTMLFGSFVAGFTALGGGAISFPVLTKLLGFSIVDARQFGVLIQSIGMTSASVFLLRRHGAALIDKNLLTYLTGAILGGITAFGWLEVNAATTKAIFSLFIITFALLNVARFSLRWQTQPAILFLAGLAGGALSHIIGTGADGVFFVICTVLFGAPVRETIWRSIIVMAATSLVLASANLTFSTISPLVMWSWAAAAPVVIFGASFGAFLTAHVKDIHLRAAFLALALLEAGSTVMQFVSS